MSLHPCCLAALVLLPAAAAHAQSVPADTGASAPTDLQRVHVVQRNDAERTGIAAPTDTATGLGLSPRETPQSLSVVSRDRMDDFSLTSAHDLLANVTGINVERVETDRTYYTARGFDITNFQLDGIGLPFTNGAQWGDVDTAIDDRVEVLRGANGLLSSTGNPSATVNFVRKRPTAGFQANAALRLGSWNDRRLEGDVSGPLDASGTVRGRLVVAGEDRNSYLDRYRTNKAVLSAMIDVDLAPGTVLSLAHVEQRNRSHAPMWGALPLYFTDGSPTDDAVSTSTSANWSYWNNTDSRSTAELRHGLGGDWRAQATLMHRRLGSDAELLYVYGTPDRQTGDGLYSYPSAFSGSDTQWLGDVRVSGPYTLAGRSHQLMAGASVGRETAREHSGYGTDIGTPLPGTTAFDGSYPKGVFDASSAGADFANLRQSVFAATRLNLSDRLKLIAGVNTSRATSDGDNYGAAHVYAHTATTPYLGAVVDLDAQSSLYGSTTRIFNPQSEVDVNRQVLAPIQGRNLEFGVKREWLAQRLLTSLAVFRTQQSNTAESAGTLPDSTAYYRPVNATSTGFEAEVGGRPAPGWELNAGYTQLRLKDDATGADTRTDVPRRTLRASTTARVPGVAGLKVGSSLTWQSAISRDQGSTAGGDPIVTRQGAYALLGLLATYELNAHVSAAVNVENVTDRKHLTSLYWAQAYYGAPREVLATLRWKY